MTQDEIIRMAREAGLMQVHSCCNVPTKLCNLDVWQGNIQAFFAIDFNAGAVHEQERHNKALKAQGAAWEAAVLAERVRMCKQFNILMELANETATGNEAD